MQNTITQDVKSKCDGQCKNKYPCPNVRPGYRFHTQVNCQKCVAPWLWGTSWDQNKEADFMCPKCKEEKKLAQCKKCENLILGEEDSLCGECAN